MTKEELKSLLGVEKIATTTQYQIEMNSYGGDIQELSRKEIHPTTLALTEFERQQGTQLQAKAPALAKTDANAVADFHSAAYLRDPELAEVSNAPEIEQKFMQTLLETPEYKALHESTALNDLASEMAACSFAGEYAVLVEGQQKRDAKRKGSKRRNPEKEALEDEIACTRAVGKAISKAAEEVEQLEDTCTMLGLGGDGGTDGKMNLTKVREVFSRVRDNKRLREICERAGRFIMLAQSKQRHKVQHGYDDVIGVELSGDVGRILPVELATLGDPLLELDTMRRLVEHQCMSRQFEGVEPVGKGPIVVCVDESGSMDGEPIANAKAFALAMARVAKLQNRICMLVGYSGGTEGTRLVLRPGKWDESALLEWLEHFYSGGTTMDVPLVELPTTYWTELNAPKGKTDVILITDAIVRVPTAMRETFLRWKAAEKVRVISLILGTQPGELAAVSDEVHCIQSISVQESAIGSCLSI